MSRLDEIRSYALSQLGRLDHVTQFPTETLTRLEGRVPNSLIEMLATLGIGTWGNGKWQTVDPLRYDGLLRQTFRGDPDFIADDCTAFAIKGFGDLTCWHRRFGLINVNVLPNAVSSTSFFEGGPADADQAALSSFSVVPITMGEYYDKYAPDGKGLFKQLVAAHGPLAPGQIFAPRLHPAIGGSMSAENFRPASALEATALLHQMEPFVFMDHRKPRAVEVRKIGRQ